MKKNILKHIFCIFFLLSIHAIGQQEEKFNLSIGFGHPTHTDMDVKENSFLFSIDARHNFSRFINWSLFFNRASANSELSFFNDTERVLELINSTNTFGIGINRSRIETYALGAAIHFAFINNKRNFFSIGFGGGYYTSKSSRQFLDEVTFMVTFTPEGELIDSRVTDFVGATDVATKTEPFIIPSLTYQYMIKGKYFVGAQASALWDRDSDGITFQPVLANYYSLSIQLGTRF